MYNSFGNDGILIFYNVTIIKQYTNINIAVFKSFIAIIK